MRVFNRHSTLDKSALLKGTFVFCLFFLSLSTYGQFQGRVVDEEGETLPGVHIHLLPLNEHTSTDGMGRFSFPSLRNGTYTIELHALGFYDTSYTITYDGIALDAEFTLLSKSQTLSEVDVVGIHHDKQEDVLQAVHLSGTDLQNANSQNFSATLEAIPGVSAIRTGTSVAKPVIRGLFGQRVIVLHQGIKQESQQWSADHGLEVDAFGVDRVEIVKGPSSLLYGSDAIGGLIHILPPPIPKKNTLSGQVVGLFNSVSNQAGGAANINLNYNDFFLHAQYSRKHAGDYTIPASQFTYNGFTLPIFDNQLKNTASVEENFSVAAGFRYAKGHHRLTLNRYQLEAGLFPGATAIPRAYTLTDDGNSRNITFPSQRSQHWRATYNGMVWFKENHLSVDLGLQHNLRQEFSFPEFHSVDPNLSQNDTRLAIELALLTLSGNIHYDIHLPKNMTLTVGGNAQWQQNKRGGFDYFLPDFTTFRSGIYGLWKYEKSRRLLFSGGLRGDVGNNVSDGFTRYVWAPNGSRTDSLISQASDNWFYNVSASAGMQYKAPKRPLTLKANLSKSFRIPYPNETSANGVHHGTFRHEQGLADLSSEHGYQLDVGLSFDRPRFSGSIATYANIFQNFIYLGPSNPARFSTLPEAGQLFTYAQDNAVYTGFEYDWTWTITPWLQWNQRADFVQSFNLRTNLALPFTPQPALRNKLTFSWSFKKYVDDLSFSLIHVGRAPARGGFRTDRTELETDGSSLFHAQTKVVFRIKNQPIECIVNLQNAFNTAWMNHLSRYRWINLPEPGRNLSVMLRVPFTVNLKQNP